MTDLFVNYRGEIQKENHHFAFADTRKDAVTICEELNRMYEENRKLRLENSRLSHDLFWANKSEKELKQRLELYGEIYPTGKWITELNSEELEKELEE